MSSEGEVFSMPDGGLQDSNSVMRKTKSEILLMLGLLAGCHHDKPAVHQSFAPQPVEQWSSAPMAVPPAPVLPVKEGPVPLYYMVETAATVRFVDITTGQELVKTPVPSHTIVAVDARAGVQVGESNMRPGPLPGDHRYAIYLVSDQESYISRGSVRPGQPGQTMFPSGPTSQPGGAP